MPDLVLWETCRRCTYFAKCNDPFSASGMCPHPATATLGSKHPLLFTPEGSELYESLLHRSEKAASMFHCWLRGKIPGNEDYLFLWTSVYEKEPPLEEAYCFIIDIMSVLCAQWMEDVRSYYYDISRSSSDYFSFTHQIAEIIRQFLAQAVRNCDRSTLEAYGQLAYGADWARLIIDQVRWNTWRVLHLRHLDLSPLDNEQFRTRFEEEWSRLLRFQDDFYGFRVLPRLSYDDLVRYSLLPKNDSDIRSQISDYFIHQGTEYPHWQQLSDPDYSISVFHNRLKKIYQPLINGTVEKALFNSQIAGKDTRARADIEAQVWHKFEESLKKFRFYGPRKKTRLWGKMGLIGLPRSAEPQQHLETQTQAKGLKSDGTPLTLSDLSEVGFSYYIELKLKAWLNRNYPPEFHSRELVGDYLVENRAPSPTLSFPPTNTFLGLDGVQYMQRRAAAEFYGVTEHQLRNWDRDATLPAQRAGAVLALPLPPGLHAKNRLYPRTEEGRRHAADLNLRKATRSTRADQGECTRKIAASYIGVLQSTLFYWESKGWLQPQKRGNSVIYSPADIEIARKLKEERLDKKK